MLPVQRRQLLLDRLQSAEWATTADLAAELGVSQVTVRRDLEQLRVDGLVQRQRGGARLIRGSALIAAAGSEGGSSTAFPVRLAAAAAALVEDGDAVLIGAGAGASALAELLVGRRGLTVVTNSVLVAEALSTSPSVDVVLTGGSVDAGSLALVGGAAEHALAGLHARRAFVTGDGLTAERGLSDSDHSLAAMHRAVAEAAAEVVVLAPERIVGRDGPFQTVPPERIAHVVTDDVSGSVAERFRALGVRVRGPEPE